MSNTLGVFTLFSALAPVEQDLVLRARKSANSSADHKLCFKSDFPVGSAILATNDQGETRVFEGCNIENDSFPATICAERNAATTAAFQGYKRFKVVALLCRKFPGGSPCGVCRQVLNQFGRDAILLNVCDHDNNVRRCTVGDLLPAAAGEPVPFAALSPADKRLVRRLAALKSKLPPGLARRVIGATGTAHIGAYARQVEIERYLAEHGPADDIQHAGQGHARRQGEHPGEKDFGHRLALDAGAVGHHDVVRLPP